ncbi:hypothetical protein CEP51_013443 [Fusarium floridanum]|uniref:C2H2-type domain-containing protein n=1 Tax=Fusarium floridanum TaxID=1325733 RepID=A0A428QBI7_9HYPO|nr:hypothetical protein CEP51_013443 [Fusarium floridanum]
MAGSTLDELLNAPESQIRSVLGALCSDGIVQRHALEHFDALKSEEGSSGGQKRKAAGELLICVQCDQPFTEEENDKKACWYHWGELEVDRDSPTWDDWDERCHGTIDTETMREEHPDGFTWNCCDNAGSETGCVTGRHESHPNRSKKASGCEPSDSEDLDDDEEEEDEEDYW